jgi:hypothetical protein
MRVSGEELEIIDDSDLQVDLTVGRNHIYHIGGSSILGINKIYQDKKTEKCNKINISSQVKAVPAQEAYQDPQASLKSHPPPPLQRPQS